MTPEIAARIRKVKAMMGSPNAGERANAERMYRQLTAKYGSAAPGARGSLSADEARHRRAELNEDSRLFWLQERRKDANVVVCRWLRENGYAYERRGELRQHWQKSTLRYAVRLEHSGANIADVCWTELPELVARLQRSMDGI